MPDSNLGCARGLQGLLLGLGRVRGGFHGAVDG